MIFEVVRFFSETSIFRNNPYDDVLLGRKEYNTQWIYSFLVRTVEQRSIFFKSHLKLYELQILTHKNFIIQMINYENFTLVFYLVDARLK